MSGFSSFGFVGIGAACGFLRGVARLRCMAPLRAFVARLLVTASLRVSSSRLRCAAPRHSFVARLLIAASLRGIVGARIFAGYSPPQAYDVGLDSWALGRPLP